MEKAMEALMKKKTLIPFCAVLLFALMTASCILPLLDGLTYESSTGGVSVLSGSFKGFDLIWGRPETDKQTAMSITPGLLAAWIFMLVAALGGLLVLLASNQGKKKFKNDALLALFGLCALVGGILFFCAKPLSSHTDGSYTLLGYTTFKLALGFLLPALFGVTGGVLSFVPLFLKK
jgi:hypothetical protein